MQFGSGLVSAMMKWTCSYLLTVAANAAFFPCNCCSRVLSSVTSCFQPTYVFKCKSCSFSSFDCKVVVSRGTVSLLKLSSLEFEWTPNSCWIAIPQSYGIIRMREKLSITCQTLVSWLCMSNDLWEHLRWAKYGKHFLGKITHAAGCLFQTLVRLQRIGWLSAPCSAVSINVFTAHRTWQISWATLTCRCYQTKLEVRGEKWYPSVVRM